jgi:uncharacterized protein (TIGR02996 family)
MASKVSSTPPQIKSQFQFSADHRGFQTAIEAEPADGTARASYCDFLEERGLHYSRESKRWLMESTEPTTFTLCRGGRVWCGRVWSVPEIREWAVSNRDSQMGSTAIVDTAVYSGPAGVFFVVGERSLFLNSPIPVSLYQFDADSRRLWRAIGVYKEPRLKGLKKPTIEDARWLAAKASGAAVPSLPPSLRIRPLPWKGASGPSV